MSLRFRKSFGVLPGVRVTVGKRGLSTSVGVNGARVTVGQKGTRATVGVPGTGLSYNTRIDRGRSSSVWKGLSQFAVMFLATAAGTLLAPLTYGLSLLLPLGAWLAHAKSRAAEARPTESAPSSPRETQPFDEAKNHKLFCMVYGSVDCSDAELEAAAEELFADYRRCGFEAMLENGKKLFARTRARRARGQKLRAEVVSHGRGNHWVAGIHYTRRDDAEFFARCLNEEEPWAVEMYERHNRKSLPPRSQPEERTEEMDLVYPWAIGASQPSQDSKSEAVGMQLPQASRLTPELRDAFKLLWAVVTAPGAQDNPHAESSLDSLRGFLDILTPDEKAELFADPQLDQYRDQAIAFVQELQRRGRVDPDLWAQFRDQIRESDPKAP